LPSLGSKDNIRHDNIKQPETPKENVDELKEDSNESNL
jgi:hypothetical protein